MEPFRKACRTCRPVFLLAWMILLPGLALAEAVTVDTLNDVLDGDTASIAALTTNPGADTVISLREAIIAANNTAGADDVTFSVEGVLYLTELLPSLSDSSGGTAIHGGESITIRAVSETGVPVVDTGLSVLSADNLIEGLSIDGCREGFGIDVSGVAAARNRVRNCRIGSENDVLRNHCGIMLRNGVSDAIIGGTLTDEANVLSGNFAGLGVDSAHNIQIFGNFVGTDPTGTYCPLPSRELEGPGIWINEGSEIAVGGGDLDTRNVIAGYGTGIVVMWGHDNWIKGNYIGCNAPGTALPEGVDAGTIVGIEAANETRLSIGGSGPGQGNVVSGASGAGLCIGDCSNVKVQGNYFGTDAGGLQILDCAAPCGVCSHCTNTAIYVVGESVFIGGPNPGEGNVISGARTGISMNNVYDLTVQGNRIGTDVTGTQALGNDVGIEIKMGDYAVEGVFGGAAPGAGNVISGNSVAGVCITGYEMPTQRRSNQFLGNYVGVDSSGLNPLANGVGVMIGSADGSEPAESVVVGLPGAGNVISGNAGAGVAVYGAGSAETLLQGKLDWRGCGWGDAGAERRSGRLD